MKRTAIGILMMAYGSPNTIEEVGEYFTDIRHGHKPNSEEIAEIQKRYSLIGGRSPLLQITQQQAASLQTKLESHGINARAYVGMRHWRPFIKHVVRQMVEDGITEIVSLPLSPFGSPAIIGGYEEAMDEALKDAKDRPRVHFVRGWHDHPLFLETWEERLKEALSGFQTSEMPPVVFTAHSLPKELLKIKNDPYEDQVHATGGQLAKRLELARWSFAYHYPIRAHSTEEKWLGPDIFDKIARLATEGVQNVIVAPLGFISDNLEVLYYLDIKCKSLADNKQVILKRTQSLNVSPKLIDLLTFLIRDKISVCG